MKKEIMKQETSALAIVAQSEFVGGMDNLELPRLLVVNNNNQSEEIQGLKLDAGSVIDTSTMEVVGKPGQAISIIPLVTAASWLIYDVTSAGAGEFKGVEPYTGVKLAYEDEVDGVKIRRVLGTRLLFLLANDKEGIPYSFTFKKSRLKVGESSIPSCTFATRLQDALRGHAAWTCSRLNVPWIKTRSGRWM
jgi:hypothetical protein